MYRFPGYSILSLLLVCCLLSTTGCPPESEFRRVWLVNQSDCPISGLYACSDPRKEEWGENLISVTVEQGGFALVDASIRKDQPSWLWPYLEHRGLMTVCVLPGETDIYVVVAKTESGDYRAGLAGGGRSPVSARYLLQ